LPRYIIQQQEQKGKKKRKEATDLGVIPRLHPCRHGNRSKDT
jgi:hypothetical protein